MINPTYFLTWNRPFEGYIPWLYLDVRGLATIGVGCLVDPVELFLVLPMRRPDGSLAGEAEKRAEWQSIKDRPELAQQGHRAAQKIATLYLDDAAIADLVTARLRANDDALRKTFPGMKLWPHEGQLFAHSMAWACGSGWPRKFPKCAAALKAEHWAEAAAECKIREAGNPGLINRNKANKVLLEYLAGEYPQGHS